jgi:UDP-N-acetylmuramoyl-tripeptide--D-alanyl-D-alanine ligase
MEAQAFCLHIGRFANRPYKDARFPAKPEGFVIAVNERLFAMTMLIAGEIESAVKGTVARGSRDAVFTGVSIDSRTVAPGEIFFAIRGPRMDGHRFIADASARGALGAVAADDYVPSGELPEGFVVIKVKDTHEALKTLARSVRAAWKGASAAVTGSVGKTTTREFAYQLISTRFRAYQTPGNYNNLFGLPLALFGLNPEHEIGIFEMGMSTAGEIDEMCRIALPETGILTNVAPAHLEFFASLEQIAEAKGELVDGLAPDGTLIYNADDPLVVKLAGRFGGKKISFGQSENADIRADDIEIRSLGETRFRLSCGGATFDAALPFAGKHYVMNALPGVAFALSLGMVPEEIISALGQLRQAKMRGRILRFSEGVAVIDDSYNSSPRALQVMIETLAAVPGFSRRILFAGEMLELGPDAPGLHFECGEFAAKRGIDVVVGVAGNAGEIVRAAKETGKGKVTARFFETSEEAAKFAVENIQPGDLALIKGSRGVRMENIISIINKTRAGCPLTA